MVLVIDLPVEPTVDDLADLPDGHRYELREGNLLIMSPATAWHSRIERELTQLLLRAGRVAYQEVGIKFGLRDSRTPDITVFPGPINEKRAFFQPEEVELVVEIVSPSSEEDDHVGKPVKYAKAGIPEFWRVERGEDDEAVIVKHKLTKMSDGTGVYVQVEVTTMAALARLSR